MKTNMYLPLTMTLLFLLPLANAIEYSDLRRTFQGDLGSFKILEYTTIQHKTYEETTRTIVNLRAKDELTDAPVEVTLSMKGNGRTNPKSDYGEDDFEYLTGHVNRAIELYTLRDFERLKERQNTSSDQTQDPIQPYHVITPYSKIVVLVNGCLGKFFIDIGLYNKLMLVQTFAIQLENKDELQFKFHDTELVESNFNSETHSNDPVVIQQSGDGENITRVNERVLSMKRKLEDFKREMMGLFDSEADKFTSQMGVALPSSFVSRKLSETLL
jgi:hypothetical protein